MHHFQKEGRVMAVCTHQNMHVEDATTAKVKACLQAVLVAEELGFRNLALEGDCLIVIKKIKDKGDDRLSIAVIIQEIKQKSLRFESFTCMFVGRLTNQAAHAMAAEGKQWPNQRVWVEEAPYNVELVVEKDKRFTCDGENGSEEELS